jgi:hypothetical protein
MQAIISFNPHVSQFGEMAISTEILSLHRRHLPAKLRKQPDGGLLDKLVFGVRV